MGGGFLLRCKYWYYMSQLFFNFQNKFLLSFTYRSYVLMPFTLDFWIWFCQSWFRDWTGFSYKKGAKSGCGCQNFLTKPKCFTNNIQFDLDIMYLQQMWCWSILHISYSIAAWWQQHGINCLELQRIAMRILSQTCSSIGCEHNWSSFDRVYTTRLNHFAQKKLNDVTYVHYNLRLKERQSKRMTDDSMSIDSVLLDSLFRDWVIESEKTALQEDEVMLVCISSFLFPLIFANLIHELIELSCPDCRK